MNAKRKVRRLTDTALQGAFGTSIFMAAPYAATGTHIATTPIPALPNSLLWNLKVLGHAYFGWRGKRRQAVNVEVLIEVEAEKLRGLLEAHGQLEHVAQAVHPVSNH